MKNVFGFVEDQENAIYGLGYQLILKKQTGIDAIFRDAATANAKAPKEGFVWFVQHYTPNTTRKRKLSEQIVSRTPIELNLVEKSVFRKDINEDMIGILI